MIDISRLKDSDEGRKVVFSASNGRTYSGVITKWDDKFIYVNYTKGLSKIGTPTNPAKLVFKKK